MYIYMLKCANNSLYTGIAADIEKRIRQHLGEIKGGAKYTKSHKPIQLVSLWKTESESGARRLEIAIKALSRKEKEILVEGNIGIFRDNLSEYDFAKESINELNEKFFSNKKVSP